jgi:hypothetical protein
MQQQKGVSEQSIHFLALYQCRLDAARTAAAQRLLNDDFPPARACRRSQQFEYALQRSANKPAFKSMTQKVPAERNNYNASPALVLLHYR